VNISVMIHLQILCVANGCGYYAFAKA